MGGCGTPDHEGVGAAFLTGLGLSDACAYLTAHHVAAKRYLVWQDPQRALSDASRTTLKHQVSSRAPRGGLVVSVCAFHSDPYVVFPRAP
jgi:predicted HD phosphohydrolase